MIAVLAVSCGAVCGALLRWGAGVLLRGAHPFVPVGSLAVNVAGGYLIGVAAACFAFSPGIPSTWCLLLVTGFLGSFTTFSAFSLEAATLLREGRYLICGAFVLAHVGGSVAATLLGMATAAGIRGLFVGR